MYKIIKIDNNTFQICGQVKGFMVRNSNGEENVNHYDFSYRYFDKNDRLIKISGICKNVKHLIEKIDKELKENI